MRKYRKNVILMAALLLLSVFLMTGCEQEEVYVPVTVNTIEALADGSLTGYIVEPFEKEYYDIKELEDMVRSEIDLYNEEKKSLSNGAGRVPVRVEKVIMAEDGSKKAVVALNFLNAEVYQDYMGKELFYGTVNEAVVAGFQVEGNLTSLKNGEVFTSVEIEKNGEEMILIVEDAVSVRTPEKVQYLSDNASVTKEGFVDCTTSEELKYIIMK